MAAYQWRRRHRMQREQLWTQFLIDQRGRCGICTSATADLLLDHDHACCSRDGYAACGRCYRGLLCYSCNTRLAVLDRMLGTGTRADPG